MQMLKAKLFEKLEEERMATLEGIRGEKKDIGWGSQIRSYVFHPYNLVKDHRTNVETGNVQAVMDGNLDQIIEGFLKKEANLTKPLYTLKLRAAKRNRQSEYWFVCRESDFWRKR